MASLVCAPSCASPATGRARVNAICSQVSASLGLIFDKTRELGRERSLAAGRAQPHIDFIKPAPPRRDGQGGDKPLRQPSIIVHRMKRPRAVGLRPRGIEIIDEHEIEIRGRRHFARAKLAKRQNISLPPGTRPCSRAKTRSTWSKRCLDDACREARIGERRARKVRSFRTTAAGRWERIPPARNRAAHRGIPRSRIYDAGFVRRAAGTHFHRAEP